MHHLQPVVDFLSQNWWVWLVCALFLFSIRVRLIPRGDDDGHSLKGGRFLRNAVEVVMWGFGVLFALSMLAVVGQRLGFL